MLLASVFIIATCGILYELLLGSISTYFLGSSILQFSITIGLFMFFMGVGSYLSRFIKENLLEAFIYIEIILSIVGGFSALILYAGFTLTENYYLIVVFIIALIGTFVGLEIPLIARIINQYSSIRETMANVLSFDYIGALLASLIFPLVLLPYYGVMKTAFIVGIINCGVAIFNAISFKHLIKKFQNIFISSLVTILILLVGFIYSFRINSFFEQLLYQDDILLTRQSQYQRIIVTKWNQDFRLFLNGHLQFSSVDEYRYHEPFVHVPMLTAFNHENILVLGGGDGMAVREILKYPEVKKIDVVDLDPEMTKLASEHFLFTNLNENSLNNAKVKIHNEDAFNFIKKSSEIYSAILIDLPDSNDTGLGKLYSKEFYQMLSKRLALDGVMVTQATSPYFARNAFWCIVHTLQSVFPVVVPYTTYVPTFGQWGFVMAGNKIRIDSTDNYIKALQTKLAEQKFHTGLKYVYPNLIPSLFIFDNDINEIPTDTNTLNTQKLVNYYETSAREWQ
ncbi:MAG: hypothetical protein A2309_01390 [Bacteroidetes bacterium RIFOXYB2_FULL_35_7]|nr:MAG: hypothetical protein A2309_01390 [Bacteroidetes bacterium RIFOXYB2_FULL_35_7]